MRIESSRVLVTGGAGFIGSHIVRSLLERGAEVAVFDNLSTGSLDKLGDIAGDVELIEGDIRDGEAVQAACEGRDIISHHAAQLEITGALADPVRDLRTNTEGTLNVLIGALKAGAGKVMNASSATVYGQAVTPMQTESHPTDPNWEYGISKLAAEKYGRLFYEHDGLAVTSLRYAIIYGEREWYRRVLTVFLKRALEAKPLIVFGEGEQVRDFTYVGDLVEMHNLCIENPASDGGSFNVSTGTGISIDELAVIVRDATGVEVPIEHEDVSVGGVSEKVEGRLRLPHELQRMVPDPALAKRVLGWSASTSLAEGIQREITWLTEDRGLESW